MLGPGVPSPEAWMAIVTIGVLFAFVAWLCRPRGRGFAAANARKHLSHLTDSASRVEAEALAAKLRARGMVAVATLTWMPDEQGGAAAKRPCVAVHNADLERARQAMREILWPADEEPDDQLDDEDDDDFDEALEDDEPEQLFDASEWEHEGAMEDAARWPELIRERARRLRGRRWSRYLLWLLLVWPLVIVAMCTLQ